MKKAFLITFLISFFSFFGFSQISAVQGGTSYPFLVSQPSGLEKDEKAPLLLFLHGKSLSGTDLHKVRSYGVIHELDKGRKVPMMVVAPQVKKGESWSPEKLNTLLDFLLLNYNIDSTRIYVAGMSLGGYGTMHFAGKYAHRIAAAAAFCGGGNVIDACALAEIPLWIIHGTNDKAVPYSESTKMVKAIEKCKTDVKLKFTSIPGGNHGAPEKYFHMDEFYEWLLSFEK